MYITVFIHLNPNVTAHPSTAISDMLIVIFAVLDVSLAVNLCINCSFFTFIVDNSKQYIQLSLTSRTQHHNHSGRIHTRRLQNVCYVKLLTQNTVEAAAGMGGLAVDRRLFICRSAGKRHEMFNFEGQEVKGRAQTRLKKDMASWRRHQSGSIGSSSYSNF